MTGPLFKVFHFPQYMRCKTVFVGFDYQAAADFASEHGREYATNGCYIAAIYPKGRAA